MALCQKDTVQYNNIIGTDTMAIFI